jgi:glycine dehydrogenase subunit 1
MSLLGEAGLKRLARLNHSRAVALAKALRAIPGVELLNKSFFNELTIRLPVPAAPVVEMLAQAEILAGVPVSRLEPHNADCANLIVLAATELTTDEDIDMLTVALAEVLK